MRRISALLAALVFALCGALLAQSGAPPGQAQFRAGVEVVRLDVSVLDRDRQPIRGLTAADFTILENGQPQPIVAFSPVDIPDVVATPAAWMRDVGSDVATNMLDVRSVVIIVMDDAMTDSDPGTGKTARLIARNVIDRLGPNDLAAVVFTYQGGAQNFTTDHRRLIAAAETFIPKFGAAPSPMSAAAGPKGSMGSAGTGAPLGCKFRVTKNCLTDTLRNVASALQDSAPGRKTLVLVSSGVPYDFSFENLEAGDEIDDLRETFANLQRANIAVYPFDPSGLTASGIISARLDSLRTFADSTGGRPVIATNTPWDHVDQVFKENSSYYLIGFQPTSAVNDGRFRRVTVKVQRADADVRTRSGYFSSNSRARPLKKQVAPVTALDRAMASGLPTGELPLEVQVAPFALPAGKQAAVAIIVGMRRPVSAAPAPETFEVLSTAIDRNFKERASVRQTLQVTLRPGPKAERRVETRMRLVLPAGRYEIRVAAEGAGLAGGAFTDVEVPDFSKSDLALSGLVLGQPRVGEPSPSDVLAAVMPIVATVRREFVANERMTAFARIYHGAKNPATGVQLSARILGTVPAPVFEDTRTFEASRFTADRSADYALELPLARLAAGEYLLIVEATRDKQRTNRSVRFRVN
jgi:VWFA-related protein